MRHNVLQPLKCCELGRGDAQGLPGHRVMLQKASMELPANLRFGLGSDSELCMWSKLEYAAGILDVSLLQRVRSREFHRASELPRQAVASDRCSTLTTKAAPRMARPSEDGSKNGLGNALRAFVCSCLPALRRIAVSTTTSPRTDESSMSNG